MDIPRTPLGDFERDEEEKEKIEGVIFNVLRAYANHDPDVGYVQGMNHLVATLAYNLHPSKYQNIKCNFILEFKNSFVWEETQRLRTNYFLHFSLYYGRTQLERFLSSWIP